MGEGFEAQPIQTVKETFDERISPRRIERAVSVTNFLSDHWECATGNCSLEPARITIRRPPGFLHNDASLGHDVFELALTFPGVASGSNEPGRH